MANKDDHEMNQAKSGAPERRPNDGALSASTKPRRRWLKWLLIFVVFIGVLVALLPMLASGPGKGMLLSTVSKQLNGSASADSIDIGWFSDAKIEGLKVQHERADKPNVQVNSLSMSDSGLWGLAFGSPIKSKIVLDGVTVRGTKRNGILDLADIMKPTGEEGADRPR